MKYERDQKAINDLEDWKNRYPKGVCLFCYEKCIHDNYPVLGFENLEHWHLIHNVAPYKNTEKHYVLILKRHLDNQAEKFLTKEEKKEQKLIYSKLPEFVIHHNKKKDQTEIHLHYHLIQLSY